VKQPIGKVTIQISRGGRVAYMPLEAVIRDPAQNIRLEANDVVTALYQPFSFTALGQTGSSAEVPFESTGLTLAQALGRVGGLKDDRANVRGAFIFRLEDPAALDPTVAATARRTPDGRIPVIYRIDLSNPTTFFAAQSFPVRDKDILYVSAAPLSDFQRFFGMVSSMTFSLIGLSNAIP
jgi:polysaccharide export outer membrane protein